MHGRFSETESQAARALEDPVASKNNNPQHVHVNARGPNSNFKHNSLAILLPTSCRILDFVSRRDDIVHRSGLISTGSLHKSNHDPCIALEALRKHIDTLLFPCLTAFSASLASIKRGTEPVVNRGHKKLGAFSECSMFSVLYMFKLERMEHDETLIGQRCPI